MARSEVTSISSASEERVVALDVHYRFLFKLALLTGAATLVLIALGGTVRATGAGLACPDWPLCEGRVIPRVSQGTTIEFAHRLAAAAVGSLALGMGLYSLRIRRAAPHVFYPAVAAGILVIGQVILGAAVIFARLPAYLVTAHLGMATAFAATVVLIAAFSYVRLHEAASIANSSGRATGFTLLACVMTYALLLVGSYVGSSGSSLACADWPLCNGSLIPAAGWREWIGFIHRLMAIAMAASVLWAYRVAIASRMSRQVRALLLGASVLTLVEIMVGALNPILKVAPAVVVAHLVVAMVIWMLLTGAAALLIASPRAEATGTP